MWLAYYHNPGTDWVKSNASTGGTYVRIANACGALCWALARLALHPFILRLCRYTGGMITPTIALHIESDSNMPECANLP